MKKTAVAVAVAVSALGLSQFAAADFVKDSKLSLDLRNYYFNQNTDKFTNASGVTSQEVEGGQWGQAFMLNYKSGFTEGAVGFGVDLFGAAAYKLADHGDQQNAMLFGRINAKESEDRLNKGGATLKARVGKTTGYLGSLRPNTPVFVSNDARMLPQLVEGVMITNQDLAGLTLSATHLTKVSHRDSDSWDALGDEELSLLGADYKIMDGLTAQYYYSKWNNNYGQHFAGLKYAAELGVGKLSADLRYFDTSPTGEEYGGQVNAQGERFDDNKLWSALVNYSVAGHTVGLGYQEVSGDTGFKQVSNSNYVISERMIGNGLMTNVDEKVTLVSYGFDFGTVGAKGLSATILHQMGDGGTKNFDHTETDVIIGYVVPEGQLKGLGVRLMHGMYDGDNVNADIDQTRFIVNYSIPLM